MQAAVDFVARCIASKASQQIGNVTIKQLTQEEYEALDPKDPNTLYFVYSGDNVIQYMGDTKLTTGILEHAFIKRDNVNTIVAQIELEEEMQ